MKLTLQLTLCFLIGCTSLSAQTIAAGDIAFTSAKVSNGDGFSFVTFIDLCPGTQLIFSDMPWRNETNKFCTSDEEFAITFTVTSRIDRGTVVVYNDGSPGSVTMASGAATLSWTLSNQHNNGFSSDGDNVFAFTGTYANPTFIAGMKIKDGTWMTGTVSCNDRQETRLPASLTNGTNALYINPGGDGMRYTGTFTGTRTTLGAAINNSANWSNSNTLSLTSNFTVTGMAQDPTTCAVVLPVGLIAFGGNYSKEEQVVELHWTTASETDNDYFELAVSPDGVNWEAHQTIDGAGNSQTVLNYYATEPVRSPGVWYYRLTSVDFDGTRHGASIVSVETPSPETIVLYPNPCDDLLYILLPEHSGPTKLQLTDSRGTEQLNIELTDTDGKIDLSDLRPGVYIVYLTSGSKTSVHQLIRK